MAALVTQNFRVHNAKQFREMFDETELFGGTSVTAAQGLLNTNVYLFIGKSDAWSGSYSDTTYLTLQLLQILLRIQQRTHLTLIGRT